MVVQTSFPLCAKRLFWRRRGQKKTDSKLKNLNSYWSWLCVYHEGVGGSTLR